MLVDIDINKPITKIKLYLAKSNKEIIGILNESYNINHKIKLGNISELSFELPIQFEINHKLQRNPHIDQIKYKYLIKLVYGNFVEWYQIENPKPQMQDDSDSMLIECMSLPIELSYKKIKAYQMESQNAQQILTDILKSVYGVSNLSKALWKFEYIHPDFNNMYRTFDIPQKSLLDFILTDIVETFDAVVLFNTENRTFSLYRKQDIGINKGLIDYGRLLQTLNKSLDVSEFCTRLKCFGENDLTIANANPTGMSYLENYGFFMFPYHEDKLGNVTSHSDYLSDSLCHNLLEYNKLIANADKEVKTAEGGTNLLKINITNHGLTTGDYILNRTRNSEYRKITVVDVNNVTLDLSSTTIAYAQEGTTTTNICILNHKLNTGDYITNQTRNNERRQITKVDDNNFTVTEILGQTLDDTILLEKYSIDEQKSEDTIYFYKNGTLRKLLYQKQELELQLTKLSTERTDLTTVLNIKLDGIVVLEEIENRTPQQETVLQTLYTERDATQLLISDKSTEIDNKVAEIVSKQTEIVNFQSSLILENYLTNEQLQELSLFTIEQIWEDTKYFDAFDLYEDGIKKFTEINSPKDNIEVNIVNLLEIVECQHDWDKLVLGDQIRLKNENLNIDVLVNIIEINFNHENGDIDLVIGDIKHIESDQDKLTKLLYKSIHTTNKLNEKSINWNSIAKNFDTRNDRISVTPADPTIEDDDPAITSVLNIDGSANIKFKWNFNGSGDAYNIDGFIVYVRSTSSNESYVFGSTIAQEQIYNIPTTKRTCELYGVPSNKYYTFGVQSYRKVDTDIDSSGYLKSNIIKVTDGINQNPHKPSSTVNFGGNVTGMVWGKLAEDVVNFIDVLYPDDVSKIGEQIDGKIETYFQDTDPNTWLEVDRLKHDGDMWYGITTKRLKRYLGNPRLIDTDSKYRLVTSAEMTAAYDTMLGDPNYNVYCDLNKDDYVDLIDTVVFEQQCVGSGDSERVVWDTTTMTLIPRISLLYSEGHYYIVNTWEEIQDQTAIDAYDAASQAQDTADGKITTFYQTTIPTAEGVGDLWVDTDDKNKLYRWDGNNWVLVRDTDISLALDQISDISSDSKITPVEKLSLKQQWDIIVTEKIAIEAQAIAFGITQKKINYTDAYENLDDYLNLYLNVFELASGEYETTNLAVNSSRTEFDYIWKDYYDNRQILLNEINNNISKTSVTFIIADGSTSQNTKRADYVVPAGSGSTSAQIVINKAISDLPKTIIADNTCSAVGTIDYLYLAGSEPNIDDFFYALTIEIYDGTGAGQNNIIMSYNGLTKQTYVRNYWNIIPDATSKYRIIKTGGEIVLLEGEYIIDDSIIVPSMTTIKGQGSMTIIKAKDSMDINHMITGENPYLGTMTIINIFLSDFVLDGNKRNNSITDGIYFYTRNSMIQNIIIKDCKNNGIDIRGNKNNILNCSLDGCEGYGINIYGNSNIISSNFISNCLYGIRNRVSTDGNISKNIIENSLSHGLLLYFNDNFTIFGNTINNSGHAGLYMEKVSQSKILSNIITGSSGETNNSYSNIQIATDCLYNSIQSNMCRKGIINFPQYGIAITSNTSTGNLITSNDLYDSGVTASINDAGDQTNSGSGNRINNGTWSTSLI